MLRPRAGPAYRSTQRQVHGRRQAADRRHQRRPGQEDRRGRPGPDRASSGFKMKFRDGPAGHDVHEVLRRAKAKVDDLPERRVVQGLRRPAVDAGRRRSTARRSSQQDNVNWPQLNDPAINDAMNAAARSAGRRGAQQGVGQGQPHDRRAGAGDPVDLGQDGVQSRPRTCSLVGNGYYATTTSASVAQVGGREVANHIEPRARRRHHARRGAPQSDALLTQHDPLHHPPPPLGGRAAPRGQLRSPS